MADQTNEQTSQVNSAGSEVNPVVSSTPEVKVVSSVSQASSQYSSVVSPSVEPVSGEPYTPVPPENPTVAVSGENSVPKWFYLVFGITLIVFFAVTTLLILSLTGKKQSTLPSSANVVSPTTIIRPTEVILPSPTVVPQATDSAGLNQPDTNNSDDINALENDLNSTNLKVLDEDLSAFDTDMSTL